MFDTRTCFDPRKIEIVLFLVLFVIGGPVPFLKIKKKILAYTVQHLSVLYSIYIVINVPFCSGEDYEDTCQQYSFSNFFDFFKNDPL